MHVAFRELLEIMKKKKKTSPVAKVTMRMNLKEKKVEADMIRYLSQVRSQDSNGHISLVSSLAIEATHVLHHSPTVTLIPEGIQLSSLSPTPLFQ